MNHYQRSGTAGQDAVDGEPRTGLAFVSALAMGEILRPPMSVVIPYDLLPPSEGVVELRALPEPRFLNLIGIVHGGWSMTLLDSAMGLAAHTTLLAGESCPSHETSVKFIRPVSANAGELRVLGRVLSRGRTVITVEGRIEDDSGKLYAHGTSTCLIVRPQPAR